MPDPDRPSDLRRTLRMLRLPGTSDRDVTSTDLAPVIGARSIRGYPQRAKGYPSGPRTDRH